MSSALRPETGLDLPPDRPPRVGIIGGGQLARMMAQAAVKDINWRLCLEEMVLDL